MLALRAIGSALSQVSSHLALSFASNLVSFALSLPLLLIISVLAYITRSIGIVPVGVVVLVAVLPNPALAGVQMMNREFSHNEFPNLGTQLTGLKQYWRPALRIWLVAFVVTAVIFVNLAFYASRSKSGSFIFGAAGPLEIVWIVVLFFWLTLHLYVYPLMLQQDVQGVFVTYRNAALMAVSRPLYTWSITIVWLAILLLFSATGLVTLIGLALSAAIQQSAFARILPLVEARSAADR